jgi:hypothetical protein
VDCVWSKEQATAVKFSWFEWIMSLVEKLSATAARCPFPLLIAWPEFVECRWMTASQSAPLHRIDCVAMLFVNDESSAEYRDN